MSSHRFAKDPAALEAVDRLGGHVRLRTLSNLRWLAIGGQTIAIVVVAFWLGHPLPLGWCLAAIAASVWLNIFTSLRYSPQRIISDWEAAGYLAYDILQLTALLFLTGGLENPFALLLLAPVTIAASILPVKRAAGLCVLAAACATFVGFFSLPLPWRPEDHQPLPDLYIVGIWTALVLGIAFSGAYAFRIALERERMSRALAAAEIVLAREERLSALGGLAAAAAHELGTPLATILLTATEMQRDLRDEAPEGSPLAEDLALLVSQAQRCRGILGRLSERGDAGDAVHDRLSIEALLEEAAEPFLSGGGGGPEVRLELRGLEHDDAPPALRRRPEILYGLRNIVENAAQHAAGLVVISADWTEERLEVVVEDDGPGFPADVITRLGEPYLSIKLKARAQHAKGGLGLGFFIAKTLLERSGGTVRFANRSGESSGARVWVEWPLTVLTV